MVARALIAIIVWGQVEQFQMNPLGFYPIVHIPLDSS